MRTDTERLEWLANSGYVMWSPFGRKKRWQCGQISCGDGGIYFDRIHQEEDFAEIRQAIDAVMDEDKK